MLDQLPTLANNPVFSGGATLMAIGAIGAYARSIPAQIGGFLWKHFVTEVTVSDADTAYDWLEAWFACHEYAKKNKSITLTTRWYDDEPVVMMTPAPGLHLVRHAGRLLWILKMREKKEHAISGGKTYSETLVIRALGDARPFIQQLLVDARLAYTRKDTETIEVKVGTSEGYWSSCGNRPLKHVDSLILDGTQLEEILADAKQFLNARSWYNHMSIPWRRGYLFYGPPGNGKSSLLTVLASELHVPLYAINLAESNLTDSTLIQLTSNIPPKGILVLEEIDTVFNQREMTTSASAGDHITFGGLLNALDGITAKEGRITVMTTNHPDKLDPALKRPGRLDRHLLVNNASRNQAARLFLRFFPEARPVDAALFAGRLPERQLSMATLQEHLMHNRTDPKAAIETARTLTA